MELQLSVAVTTAGAGIDPQSALVFAGTPASTGPVTSVTVISCDVLVVVPHKFVAVHVLVMI
jgi:hypothetical protein